MSDLLENEMSSDLQICLILTSRGTPGGRSMKLEPGNQWPSVKAQVRQVGNQFFSYFPD